MAKNKKTENENTTKIIKSGNVKDAKPIQWNPDDGHNHGSLPVAYLLDKLAHSRGWNVAEAKVDRDNKAFTFVVCCGNNAMNEKYTFDEVCNMFGWKELKFSNNDETVTPTLLPANQCDWGNL